MIVGISDFLANPDGLRLACASTVAIPSWESPHYRLVAAQLGRTPEFEIIHIEDENYGSGDASFVEIRLGRRGVVSELIGNYYEREYISVLLCHLASVAAIMGVERCGKS